MIVLSSPSGAGKTSLTKAIITADQKTRLSISVTTRTPRSSEINGKDYIFINQDQYSDLLQNNMLLEHAEVFGHCYGTPKKQTDELLSAGLDVIYDIDWQGALSLLQLQNQRVVSIFILPPSMAILEQRLRSRASDSEETIQKRLAGAKLEISKCVHYEYVIINDQFENTLKTIRSIIEAERSKRAHLTNLHILLEELHGSVKEISEKDIDSSMVIIDVRESHEWHSGHIPDAVHIPLAQLLKGEFDLDKSKPCITYCQHGVRSLTAAHYLKEHGFVDVAHLKNGLSIWQGKLST